MKILTKSTVITPLVIGVLFGLTACTDRTADKSRTATDVNSASNYAAAPAPAGMNTDARNQPASSTTVAPATAATTSSTATSTTAPTTDSTTKPETATAPVAAKPA